MIEIPARQEPAQYACVTLHGLGADGSDLSPIAEAMWPNPRARWIFPDAPVRPIAINGGMSMHGWYDVRTPRLLDWEDEQGYADSQRIVDGLIDELLSSGIEPGNIVLAGFSQGGVIALHAGLRREQPLGALVALSCYMPLADKLEQQASAGSSSTPVFFGAGKLDPLVSSSDTKAAADILAQRGHRTDFREYPIPHSISPEEIRDIAGFLDENIRQTS